MTTYMTVWRPASDLKLGDLVIVTDEDGAKYPTPIAEIDDSPRPGLHGYRATPTWRDWLPGDWNYCRAEALVEALLPLAPAEYRCAQDRADGTVFALPAIDAEHARRLAAFADRQEMLGVGPARAEVRLHTDWQPAP